jgi:putative transposase
MSDKFKNKYRKGSRRLYGWDYSRNGYYFITIVLEGRDCLFGKIENGKMILSDFGKIAYDEWFKSFEIRQELKLDEFIIMPNHLHAIVVIDKNDVEYNMDEKRMDDIGCLNGFNCKNGRPSVSTGKSVPSLFQRKPKSISSFVAGYKSAVINKIDDFLDELAVELHGRAAPQSEFAKIPAKFNKNHRLWQINYHDHIIRNDESYCKIKNYIQTNPEKWKDDKFNPNDK